MRAAAYPPTDQTRGATEPHRLTRFLWWCAGAVPEFLRDSPTERAKHAGIGGAVLSTGCLAAFAGGYALYTMADDSAWRLPIAMAGGLVWALVIFNIDRFLVSSLRKSGARSFGAVVRSELVPALPRLAFAVVIALTLAEPLELRLFSSEIEDRVDANRDRLVTARQTSLRGIAAPQAEVWRREMAAVDANLVASRQRLDALQRDYIEESDGRGGSRRVGDGPLTGIKRQEMERAAAAHERLSAESEPRRRELQRRLDEGDAAITAQLTAYRAALGSGYLARREALTELSHERAGVWGAVWGIFLLMVMVEITPLLLTIFGAYGPYDAKVAMAEQSEIREAELERDYRVDLATYHFERAREAERAVEDAAYEANVSVRTGKVREAWAGFATGFSFRSYPSVDSLMRHLREALSMHRHS